MESMLRISAMAIAGLTVVWLASCGRPASDEANDAGPSMAEIIQRQNALQAVEDKATSEAQSKAEADRLAAETPKIVDKTDFKRGKKLEGGGYLSTAIRSGLVAVEGIHMANLYHNLEIHAAANGYPNSHEEFMKLVKGWGLPLPELDGPYEYWYNPEDHKLYKRPTVNENAE